MFEAAYNSSTLTSYNKSYELFTSFVTSHGLDALWGYHAHPANLIVYLGYLRQLSLSASTARKHLTGIAHCLKNNLLPDYTKCGPVQKVIKGYTRRAKTKDLRLPISLELLEKILRVLPSVCYTLYEVALFRAAFTLTFAALLRVSEVAAISKTAFGHALLRQNVTLATDKLSLLIATSKTDQDGVGTVIHLRKSGMHVCPVELVKAFLINRPRVDGPIFCHADSTEESVNPLTKYQFNAVLKKALAALNIGSLTFSAHSFRIGATSHLAVQFDDATILRLGRWSPRGNTHKCYVRDIEMPPLQRAL